MKPQSEIDQIMAGKKTAAINQWISDELGQGFKKTGSYSLEKDEGNNVTTILNINPDTGVVSQSQRIYTPPQAPQAPSADQIRYRSLQNLQRELNTNQRLTDSQREFIRGGIAELQHELTGAPASYFLGTPATEQTKLIEAYQTAVSQNTRDVLMKRLQDITSTSPSNPANAVFNPSSGWQSMAPNLQKSNPANLIYNPSTTLWDNSWNAQNVINANLPKNLSGSSSKIIKAAPQSSFQDILNANIFGR